MSHAMNRSMSCSQRRASQRGSALLVVLVFAAIIAIMLYRELPVVAFEAQRQKEELLMDRGNEYKRAIKLYVRKFQTFPPSMEALENTNRMRFLRARYVDPFTGKDDWRVLHAGAGGTIIDSKIKLAGGANGAAGAIGGSLGAPSSVTNPFANSFVGGGGNPQGAANQFPQRPPAISNNPGGGGSGSSDMPMPGPQDSQGQAVDMANLPNQANGAVPYAGYPASPNNAAAGPTGNSNVDPSQYGQSNPMATSSGFPGAPGRFRGANPTGNSFAPGQFGGVPPTPAPQDPQSAMQSLLGNQNPTAIQPSALNNNSVQNGSFGQNGAAGGQQMGAMGNGTMGGGIAGVASKSTGHTIKVLNDQSERSLWEFVYDMQKEAQGNAAGAGQAPNGNNNNGGNNTNSGATLMQSNQNFQNNNNFGNVLTSAPAPNQ